MAQQSVGASYTKGTPNLASNLSNAYTACLSSCITIHYNYGIIKRKVKDEQRSSEDGKYHGQQDTQVLSQMRGFHGPVPMAS